jgi:hypothetical protein
MLIPCGSVKSVQKIDVETQWVNRSIYVTIVTIFVTIGLLLWARFGPEIFWNMLILAQMC